MHAIDHFMYVGTNLDALDTMFSKLSGITATPGGQHPTMGTHNSLIGSRTAVYLELLAPDPSSDVDSDIRRGIQAVSRPQLHRIICKSPQADFATILAAYARAGVRAQVHSMQRRTPGGEVLRWQLLIPEVDAHGMFGSICHGVFMPLFIDWLDTPHPATRLPPDLDVLGCEAGHPEAARLARLWQELGVDIPLRAADAPHVCVRLATPRGEILLTGGFPHYG